MGLVLVSRLLIISVLLTQVYHVFKNPRVYQPGCFAVEHIHTSLYEVRKLTLVAAHCQDDRRRSLD